MESTRSLVRDAIARGERPRVVVAIFLAEQGRKSQTWLAAKMRVSESSLSGMLTGRRRATPDLVRRLWTVTGIDLNQFPQTKAGKLTGAGITTPPAAELVGAGPAPRP